MLIAAHVRSILLDHWDPVSIRNMPKAKNEYDEYIPAILRAIQAGVSARTLADRLFTIETETMGLGGDRDRALYVAEKLLTADFGTVERD